MSDQSQQPNPGVPGQQAPAQRPADQHQAGLQNAPIGRPVSELLTSPVQPVPEGPNRLVIGLLALGLVASAFGLARSFMKSPEPAAAAPVVRQPSPWAEQQQLMRDAMTMAREAQQMQREQQERMMRAQMEAEYGGYPEEDW